jgi:hypothetical protein
MLVGLADMLKLLPALALAASGCLTYSTFDHPNSSTYAIITASEIAVAAGGALMKGDDPNDSYYQMSYGERFASLLGGIVVVDAICWLIVQPDKH